MVGGAAGSVNTSLLWPSTEKVKQSFFRSDYDDAALAIAHLQSNEHGLIG